MENQNRFTSKTSQIINLPTFIFTILITTVLLIFSRNITQTTDQLLALFPNSINIPDITSILILLLLIVIIWLKLIWKVLVVNNLYYDFENERIIMHFGVLNKKTDYIEYFRIKDYAIERPLIARLFGLHHVYIVSSDRSHPELKLKYLKNFKNRENELREGIKSASQTGRGREIDVV